MLCPRCKENASLPDDPDNFCKACVIEVEHIIANLANKIRRAGIGPNWVVPR